MGGITVAAEKVANIYEIDLKRIKESPTNPRKIYEPKALAELAESIKTSGLVHAVLLRPHPDGFELVAGSRRYRASRIAGVEAIRAEVRDLSDEQVIEIQTIENLHRQDVHPLEEAEGFSTLMQKPFNRTADAIAGMVGKSKGYVYAALKLLSLTEKSRKAFFAGKLDKSVAILLARIPNAGLQEKALSEVTREDEPVSFKRAAAHIQQHYMLRLADAPFSIKDEKLTKAGACAPCPKRTGNQRELFGDVQSADVCTDPICFREKVDAAGAVALAEAEKAGKAVVPERNAKKLFPWSSDSIDRGSGYVRLEDPCYSDEKQRSYGQLLKKAGSPAQVFVARAPSGKIVELVKESDAAAAAKAVGVKPSAGPSSNEEKKRKREQARQRAVTRATIAAVVAAVKPGPEFFRIIIRALARFAWSDALSEVSKRRGLKPTKGQRKGAEVSKLADSIELKDLGPLLLEIAITQGAYFSHRPGLAEGVKEAAAAFGVDVRKIEKEVVKQLAESEAAKPKKKKGGG